MFLLINKYIYFLLIYIGHKSKNLETIMLNLSSKNKLLKPFVKRVKADFNYVLGKNKQTLKESSALNLQALSELILC